MNAIEVRDLHKTYYGFLRRSKIEALKGVSVSVKQGEIFGLLGPNGAGKTTLIKILLGIAFADRGKALLLGRDSRDPRARLHVGYLPEDHQLPEYLKAWRALDFLAKLYGMHKRRSRVEELLQLVGIAERRNSKVKEFSKGMRQRLGIAQALLNNPKVLILDEPTANLDPLGRKDVKDLLLHLKDQGTTVFISSHVLTEIERVCDRVAILHKGQLLTEGTVDELTREKSLEDVFVELIRGAESLETV
ncbi:MAG: ABC transporter ATP-binding protein [Candidatus Bipolaricaulota bacterium]|nr:ABC transporter ATP-binding protein [Candidatus Bipolaricaulota bacterium]MDW8031460.1 ABC transporter ATP-binding protein [Candidatus Bipolaricaulota bacterium]